MRKMFASTYYCAIPVFVLVAVMGYTHAHTYICEGKAVPDGFVFILPVNVTRYIRQPHCELMLDIEGRNRAVYENGTAPVIMQFPVLKATMDNFTLAICPLSLVLDMQCHISDGIHLQILREKTHCSCVNHTASPPNMTSIWTTPVISEDHHVAVYISTAILVLMIILGLAIYKWRKKIMTQCAQHDNADSSAKSSTDALPDENIAMIKHCAV